MNTSAKLALAIAVLAPAGISYAGPTIFDTDMSLYYEDTGSGIAFNLSSSKHDTEEYKSTFFSLANNSKNEYYSCTSKDSALNIPRKAKTGSISITVDPRDANWTCIPEQDAKDKMPVINLTLQCTADGLNTGTGTGKSKRTTASGAQKYNDRYDSNSANCQFTLDGAAPTPLQGTKQGWLLNKQSKRTK